MRSICYLLCFITISVSAQPTIQWQRTYGGSGWDFPGSLVKTNSGYVLSGTTTSANCDVSGGHGTFDIWTLWLNESGALVRSKCYGGSLSEIGGSLSPVPSGYVQSAMSASNNGDVTTNHGVYDFWVFKTSDSGTVQWQKSLGGSNVDQARTVISASGGGYIVAGNASSTDFDVVGNHGLDDYWVVKLSSAGSVEWQRSLGGSGVDKAVTIIQTADGGYMVGGSSSSADGDVTENHGYVDYWVVKLSATGAIQWQKSLGGSDADELTSIQQTPDGGYIIGGSSYSTFGEVVGNHGDNDIWVVKLSSTGSIEWKKTYGGSAEDQCVTIKPVAGGGYILLGSTLSSDGDIIFNHGGSDIWIAKLSSTGSILWQRSLGGSMDEFATDVLEMAADEYTIVGAAQSYDGDVSGGHGDLDYWIVSLKCNLTSGNIAGASKVCVGATVPLTDTAAGGAWTASGASATVSSGLVKGVTPGTSVISYSVANACGTKIATLTVTVLESPVPVVTVAGGALVASAGFSQYQWFKDGVEIAGAVANGYHPTSPGNYAVRVMGANGCYGMSSVNTITTTSVPAVSLAAIQVVPNPARTAVTVSGAMIARTQVFNSVGAMIVNSDQSQDIPVGHLPAGVYYISVFDGSAQLLGRCSFVKE